MSRIRHCLECPSCGLRYLISLAPYQNGSYLVSSVNGSGDDYILFCSPCRHASRRHTTQVMLCEVSNAAYRRGFGTADDVWWLRSEPGSSWTLPALDMPSSWQTSRRKNQF